MIASILGIFISGVIALIAFLILGWWYVLWIFLAAVIFTIVGEALRGMADPSLEERPDRP